MIVGQLIQAGKRLCEYRSQDCLPPCDSKHTVLAYNVVDQIDLKTFDESSPNVGNAIKQWLIDCNSVAYIIVSRCFDCLQQEFPSPLGISQQKTVSLTVATRTHLAQMSFVTYGQLNELPLKLIKCRETHTPHPFTLKNYFAQHEPAPTNALLDLGQYTFSELDELVAS